MIDFKKVRYLRHKAQHALHSIAFLLELILAVLVIFIISLQIISLTTMFISHVFDPSVSIEYSVFLNKALGIIIGVEFLKMLCQHSMNSVIDVLLFILARHLVVMDATMFESLLCILSVAILFAIRKFLAVKHVEDEEID